MSVTKINVGDRFGRQVVTSRAPNGAAGGVRWNMKCDCGAATVASGSNLAAGRSRSCGCLMREAVGDRNRKHGWASGDKKAVEYNALQAIIQRCTNPKHKAWANYGGRGIRVCEEWRNSFESFIAHVGRRPSARHSIDRIDNDGHYEPGNVRWTTDEEQARNRRTGRLNSTATLLVRAMHRRGSAIDDIAHAFGSSSKIILKALGAA